MTEGDIGTINIRRAILGGLLAGLVVNIGEFVLNAFILGHEWDAVMQSLNRLPISVSAIILLNVMSLALGICIVLLYASFSSLIGSGYKAAVVAGLFAWFLAYGLGFGWSFVMGV